MTRRLCWSPSAAAWCGDTQQQLWCDVMHTFGPSRSLLLALPFTCDCLDLQPRFHDVHMMPCHTFLPP